MATTIPTQALTGHAAGVKQTYSETINNAVAIARQNVQRVQPNRFMFMKTMEMLNSGSMWAVSDEGDPIYWFDEGMWPQEVTVGAQFTATTTGTLTLDDTTFLKEGNFLQVDGTGESILCTADPASSTTVAIQRNFPVQSLALGNLEVGTTLRVYSQAQLQGAPRGRLMWKQLDRHENNFQILELGTGITGSQAANSTYVNSQQLPKQITDINLELRRQLNEMMLWGPAANLASATVRGTFKGFEGFVDHNVFTINGPMTYDVLEQMVLSALEFNDSADGTFQYFSSAQNIADLAKVAAPYLQTDPELKKFGFYINVIAGNGWRVELLNDFAFRGPNRGKGLLVSPQHIGYRAKKGRAFAEEMGVQTPGTDTEEVLVRGEYTMMVRNQLAHARVEGIQ